MLSIRPLPFTSAKTTLPYPKQALPGRDEPILANPPTHAVLGNPIAPPFPKNCEHILLGMGCFWGPEKLFWNLGGVFSTSVGYAGGYTKNPTYQEVCSGKTAHTEVIQIVFDPETISLDTILAAFWENHDPTQAMRQGNDIGTQYRSAIYTSTEAQYKTAIQSLNAYADALAKTYKNHITTEINQNQTYYLAEEYHQQYLHKNPGGYCAMSGTGTPFPNSK